MFYKNFKSFAVHILAAVDHYWSTDHWLGTGVLYPLRHFNFFQILAALRVELQKSTALLPRYRGDDILNISFPQVRFEPITVVFTVASL